VTPRGVGVSAGPRGAKLSVHSSGRVTQTLSLPGSGISHTKTLGPSGRLPRGSTMPTSPSRPSQPAPQVPSWIAPKWEKQLWTVTIRRPSPSDIADVAKLDTRSHHVVAFLETVMHLVPSADLASWPKCQLSRPSRSSRCGGRVSLGPFRASLVASDTSIEAALEPV
jgi:hypothetical protein